MVDFRWGLTYASFVLSVSDGSFFTLFDHAHLDEVPLFVELHALAVLIEVNRDTKVLIL
jgi:hypothetical protein